MQPIQVSAGGIQGRVSKVISEMEEENSLLKNELKMRELALKEVRDLFESQICISPHFEKVAQESEVLCCNAPSFGSVALE